MLLPDPILQELNQRPVAEGRAGGGGIRPSGARIGASGTAGYRFALSILKRMMYKILHVLRIYGDRHGNFRQ